MKFTKPALRFEQQIELLKSRGLAIPDDARALRWLRCVSYYRLSAYFLPFRENNGTENFRQGCELAAIVDLYKFDARLRLLFMQAIERIEISFRTAITYELAHSFGCFSHTDQNTYAQWFLSPNKVGQPAPFVELMQSFANEEKKARELYVRAYRQKYTSESHLPIWIATELMSLGTLSMMFRGLRSSTKTKIAAQYKLAELPFQSWMHVFTTIRNFCAHHNRLWNRQLGVKPVIPHGWVYHVPNADRMYVVTVMSQHLLRIIAPQCRWRERLFALFDEHPSVNSRAMGFPENWKALPPWR